MPISPVGSKTNLKPLELEPEAINLAGSPVDHSADDRFEATDIERLRAQSNILAAYMRMREGDNTPQENAADQKTIDQALAEL